MDIQSYKISTTKDKSPKSALKISLGRILGDRLVLPNMEITLSLTCLYFKGGIENAK